MILYVLIAIYVQVTTLPFFFSIMFVHSTNLINIYVLILKKASDFHKTNSCDLFMIPSDVTERKKDWPYFTLKKD